MMGTTNKLHVQLARWITTVAGGAEMVEVNGFHHRAASSISCYSRRVAVNSARVSPSCHPHLALELSMMSNRAFTTQ